MFNRLENLPGNTVQQLDALSHGRGDPPFLLGTERAEGGLQGISHAGLSQVSFQGRVPPPPGPAPGAAPQWADARRVPSGTTQAHGPAPRQPRKWPLARGGWRVLAAGGEERGRFLCSLLLPLPPPLPRLEGAWSREPLGALDGARGEGGARGRGGGCCARKAMRCPWPESHTQGHPRGQVWGLTQRVQPHGRSGKHGSFCFYQNASFGVRLGWRLGLGTAALGLGRAVRERGGTGPQSRGLTGRGCRQSSLLGRERWRLGGGCSVSTPTCEASSGVQGAVPAREAAASGSDGPSCGLGRRRPARQKGRLRDKSKASAGPGPPRAPASSPAFDGGWCWGARFEPHAHHCATLWLDPPSLRPGLPACKTGGTQPPLHFLALLSSSCRPHVFWGLIPTAATCGPLWPMLLVGGWWQALVMLETVPLGRLFPNVPTWLEFVGVQWVSLQPPATWSQIGSPQSLCAEPPTPRTSEAL